MTMPHVAPRILVSAASKHGSTGEIAERIAETLRRHGLGVDHIHPGEVPSLEQYQAVILGSAVYAGHWLDDAKKLANRVADVEPAPDVWLFSSGPIGDPPMPEEDPVDVADIFRTTQAREHRVFAGKIDKSRLSFGEKAIMIAVRASEGDFRDFEEITRWAEEIASTLGSGSISVS